MSGKPAVNLADHRLAAELATAAGKLLMALRERLGSDGAPAAVLRAEADRRSHEFIVSRLAEARPRDAILSEESPNRPATPDHGTAGSDRRPGADRIWIIDPLDGTREFSEPPRTDWAVHVALVIAEAPAAGAVSLPALGLTLSTLDPPELDPHPAVPPRLVVSRSRPPALIPQLADSLGAETIAMGSAGAKTMAVVRGQAELYLHSGGQYEWDSCAPVAVAAAAGCFSSRIDGSPLRYNQPDPYLPDLVVCRRELAREVLSTLARLANDRSV